ncbi:hypothetical protein SAMN04487943_106199 [Gracilibacillus orientalis]|uniref:DUF6884 domain-containing protein n=1 Tax=Gracilibacillus orientalis TaxID=334253 RepID=A0A1I4MEC7_9BACI|nr:DUF6884 domain-containing protein [Gracilibacillus orientalis]SFM01569.1 hypothetical protein SAMN04487943_106199 [Gracilibacillus orientalis]
MSQLCIIPCGKKKIWDKILDAGPTKAKHAYIGVLHRLCRQYVELYFDNWIIISGKHGLLLPDDIVPENYDVTFRPNDPNVITVEKLRSQLSDKRLDHFRDIVVLTGKKYQPIINKTFHEVDSIQYPLLGTRGIGEMQGLLKRSMANKHALHSVRKES